MRTRIKLLAAVSTILLLHCPPNGLVAAEPPPIPVVAGETPAGEHFVGFDDFVISLLDEFKVPGLALAVVQDGELVLSKGYGYRDVEKGLPVTPRTVMPINSSTKSFTVTLMGTLWDEGKLDWGAPVRKYLPDFQLYDPVATRLMTPTDLVNHRSGLPRHDMMWYGRNTSRKEIYQRLRFLEPNATFRQRYQYNNLMIGAAGYLLEQITGESWEDLIHDRIFTPLGMRQSGTSVKDLPQSGEYAVAYRKQGDKVVSMPWRILSNTAPAGAVNSNVEEMMHYIQMHIDQGQYGDNQLISKQMSKRMQSIQSATEVPDWVEGDRELGPEGYGLGLFVGNFRGHKLVDHGGGGGGFISAMSWLPDDRIGVMVLSNLPSGAPTIIERNIYDRLLGLEPIDWLSRNRKLTESFKEHNKQAEAMRDAEHVEGTHPSRNLSGFTGTFEHAGYGIIEVQVVDGRLNVTLDQIVSRLEHFHYDVFQVVKDDAWPPNPLAGRQISFESGIDGRIGRVMIPLEKRIAAINFERKERNEE